MEAEVRQYETTGSREVPILRPVACYQLNSIQEEDMKPGTALADAEESLQSTK